MTLFLIHCNKIFIFFTMHISGCRGLINYKKETIIHLTLDQNSLNLSVTLNDFDFITKTMIHLIFCNLNKLHT